MKSFPPHHLSAYLRHRSLFFCVWQTYALRLLKASVPLLLLPSIACVWLVISARLPLWEGLLLWAATAFGAVLLARFYVLDLAALTYYVRHLALGRPSLAPKLSFVSDIGELSSAIKELHASWGARRIELESALAESKVLFDTLPDVLIMLDERGMILRANVAAYAIFGDTILGRDVLELLSDEPFHRAFQDLLEQGDPRELELTLGRETSSSTYLTRLVRFPVHSSGGIAIIVILHDITEARNSRQMIKDFVANASHEIRTPLTSIIGFVETLRTSAKDDPDAHEHFLGIMADQAAHLSKLVNDLLSLSKIEMNAASPPTHRLSIAKPLETAVMQLVWAAKQKHISLEESVAPDLPLIIGDAGELTQVFVNLISNAIKYGRENSSVEIRAGVTQEIPAAAENLRGERTALFVSVTDSGEGIEAEHLPRLTQRFYRVDKSRTRKVGGTGLGLSIVKHILLRHRGALVIQSTVGTGSVFTVYFPIASD